VKARLGGTTCGHEAACKIEARTPPGGGGAAAVRRAAQSAAAVPRPRRSARA
jgi:hypothetical protein